MVEKLLSRSQKKKKTARFADRFVKISYNEVNLSQKKKIIKKTHFFLLKMGGKVGNFVNLPRGGGGNREVR